MYFHNLDKENLERISLRVKNSEKAKIYYGDLKEGHYDIYWSYDVKEHKILYEALPKSGFEGSYLAIACDEQRRLSFPTMNLHDGGAALALYIYEKEKDLPLETLAEYYSPYGESLLFNASFSKEEMSYRKNYSYLIDSLRENLVNDLSSGVTSKATDKVNLLLGITEIHFPSSFAVKVYLDSGKKIRIYDIDKLFRATSEHVNVPTRTRDRVISLSPSSFNEEDKKAISLIYHNHSRNYDYYDSGFGLPSGEIIDLIFLYKGKKILWNDRPYLVPLEAQEAKAELSEDYSFSLSCHKEGKLLANKDKGVILPLHDSGDITLLSFSNKATRSIYEFAYANPRFRYDLFQKEIGEDIVPLLEGNVKVNEEVENKFRDRRPRIRYSVSFHDEEGILEFATKCYLGDKEVDREDLLALSLGKSRYTAFVNELNKLALPENGIIASQEGIYNFLKMDLSTLNTLSEVYLSENLLDKKLSSIGTLSFSVDSGIDWFQLHVKSEELSSEELEAIIKAYKKKKKFVRLKNSFIDLGDDNDKNLAEFKKVAEDYSFSSSMKTKKLPLYQAFKLMDYNQSNLSYGEQIMNLMKAIKEYKEYPLELPEVVQGKLRPYQEDGVRWMSVLSSFRLGGILADDMGLGKTLETIALLSLYKGELPSLIVCPKSLIYNWEAEFRKWNPSFKTHLIEGDKGNRNKTLTIPTGGKDVYLVSYETMRNDINELKSKEFAYLVLDEGQNIANASAKKSQAVKQLKSEYRLVLTGTPLQNSLMDLWSIFDFLMPGYLTDQRSFYNEYVHTEEPDSIRRKTLEKKVQPFILRRKKEDVLKDLPPKTEQVLTLSMGEEERSLYMAYYSRIRKALKKEDGMSNKERADNKSYAIEILAELTRLRQLCVDPSMFLEDTGFTSSKLLFALEYIKASLNSGHKVIVFSSFVRSLEHLGELLKNENISYETISGKTPAAARVTLSQEFNNTDKIKVMLVSLKAGGTGLNLVGADIVIHLDPWWNYASESQASDRAHRLGQEKPVTVVKLIVKDSIEEKVLTLQETKKDLSDTFGGDDISSISIKDLEYLLA